jgi:hypothetical protein
MIPQLIFAGLALTIGSVLYSGLTLMVLWAWFVVPFGVMPVTLPWAIGLCVIITAVKGVPSGLSEENWLWTALKPFAVCTLCLALGYIAHLFM